MGAIINYLSLILFIFGKINTSRSFSSSVTPSHTFLFGNQAAFISDSSKPSKYDTLYEPDSSVVNNNDPIGQPISIFATTLYEIISQYYPGQNFVVSPLSIHTLLSLIFMGAKGQTADEMEAGLNLPSNNTNVVASDYKTLLTPYQTNSLLKLANAIYVPSDLTPQPQFTNYANNDFYANVQSINFGNTTAAANIINQWVSQKTDNNINDLIKPSWLSPTPDTVLVDAVYFNGLWQHPFGHRLTANVPFYNSLKSCNKSAGTVNMMTIQSYFNFGIIEQLNAAAIELPYKDSNMSMIIFIPRTCDDYSSFSDDFGNFDFTTLHSQLFNRIATVTIPEFAINFEIPNMKLELTEAGFGDLFNTPNLSGMLQDKSTGAPVTDITLIRVVHKAQIKVDQKGAEAAAATAAIFMPTMAAPPSVEVIDFVADQSFTFVIKNFDEIAFVGQYIQPESS